MTHFADRLIDAIDRAGSPCVLGLDPRVDEMPAFATARLRASGDPDQLTKVISDFHERVLTAIADLVPAVKLQSAFYEQYGLPGMRAFAETIRLARSAGMLVIADAKRNDIDSTARAYAN